MSDAQRNQPIEATFTVPIGALAILGAVFSSMIPELHTIKQTMTFDVQGLFQIANAEAGDVLKVAKNGNFWGAIKTAEGGSKMAQLQAAGPISAASTTVLAPDPTVMMVAMPLFTIEQKLSDIEKMEQQILSFLEVEKQSEIEADVQTLVSIIKNYKLNWDTVNVKVRLLAWLMDDKQRESTFLFSLVQDKEKRAEMQSLSVLSHDLSFCTIIYLKIFCFAKSIFSRNFDFLWIPVANFAPAGRGIFSHSLCIQV